MEDLILTPDADAKRRRLVKVCLFHLFYIMHSMMRLACISHRPES